MLAARQRGLLAGRRFDAEGRPAATRLQSLVTPLRRLAIEVGCTLIMPERH